MNPLSHTGVYPVAGDRYRAMRQYQNKTYQRTFKDIGEATVWRGEIDAYARMSDAWASQLMRLAYTDGRFPEVRVYSPSLRTRWYQRVWDLLIGRNR